MNFIIGQKLGSSQIISDRGEIVPVTLIDVRPNVIIQIKTKEKDGYQALQVGLPSQKVKTKSITKPLRGHFRNLGNFIYLKEFKVADVSNFKIGDRVTLEGFSEGDQVAVSATSIGRGYQGVVKRHGFKGGPAAHGHRGVLRRPGAIGGRFPQRVLKGKRMAGRMGGARVTIKNLRIIKIDPHRNIVALRGAVPGKAGNIVEIKSL